MTDTSTTAADRQPVLDDSDLTTLDPGLPIDIDTFAEIVNQDEIDADSYGRRPMDDATLDRLFGDETIARERRARGIYVLVDDDRRDRHTQIAAALLPEGVGFDPRLENEAFNMRRGRNGRGFPGKGRRLRR